MILEGFLKIKILMCPQIKTELLLLTGLVDQSLCFPLPVLVSVVLVTAVTEERTELQPCHLFAVTYQTSDCPWLLEHMKSSAKARPTKNVAKCLCWNCGGSDWALVRGRVVYTGYADLTTIRVIFKKFTVYILLTGLCPTSGKVFTVFFAFSKSCVNFESNTNLIQNLKVVIF